MYILLALLLLAILITVHEFGHFLAARAMKIEVREFAVGMMYQPAADSIHDITETAADNPQTDIFYRFHRQTGES